MAIYIPGMEMPKVLGKTITIYPNGTVRVWVNNKGSGELLEQRATPVPPHGRLGDLDELYKEALKRSETKDGYYNCLDPVISCYTIDHAPTIIPAEEEEKP